MQIQSLAAAQAVNGACLPVGMGWQPAAEVPGRARPNHGGRLPGPARTGFGGTHLVRSATGGRWQDAQVPVRAAAGQRRGFFGPAGTLGLRAPGEPGWSLQVRQHQQVVALARRRPAA